MNDFLRCVEPLGFEHVMMSNLPTGQADVRPLVMLQGWPTEWFERYVERSYYLNDAVSLAAASTCDPFKWHSLDPLIACDRKQSQIAGEACEHGLSDGILIPMLAPRGWRAVVSLGSRRKLDISPEEETAVLLTAHIANRIVRKLVGEKTAAHRLSPREREVVSWLAAGKTAWEISCILGVLESRVRRAVEVARYKLAVSTGPQLVAEAVRLREISL